MNKYQSTEDYLERILMLSQDNKKVRSIDLVHSMGFSKPSISNAVHKLAEKELIVIDQKGYLNLTDKGYAIASKVYERHVVLSSILEYLGVNHETAISDACKVEHDISDETFSKLKEKYLKIKGEKNV
ncbi:MAG: metal-dependent transcriptional regulator [Firmicutes bacterium]|uniref:Metal-dependent transcriptional regulator n=1 Tax=Candidatus Scatoplasma merdavium TaxID=2840932 RepID=A0A9D9D9T8_9BACL|nr:metal-dependent transcriptional regulator [Candidatus Scatoplasma merdavium]